MDDFYIVPMVNKTLEILDHMYSTDTEVGISQISHELQLPKTTVFRILSTLQKWGYVERDGNSDKYVLGRTLIKMGQRVTGNIDIHHIAMPIMNALSKEVGESLNLGILYENEVLTIGNSKGETFYLISMLVPISPLNCSAMGKLFLAKFTTKELKEYFKSEKPQKRTINSIVELDKYLLIKKAIESEGIAYDREEYEYGLTCIAAPICDANGDLLAALSLSGPTTRLQYKGEDHLKSTLKNASQSISKTYIEIFQRNQTEPK